MKNDSKKNCRGRPCKYLTVEKFDQFLNNDFKHLNRKVNIQFAILVAVFAAVVARLIVG